MIKFILISLIKFYWWLIPAERRRICIFSKSCSKHVYHEIRVHGALTGFKEFVFRVENCNQEFDVFTEYKTGIKKMRLSSGKIVGEDQIAIRLR